MPAFLFSSPDGINSAAYTGEEIAISSTAVGITAALLDPSDHATNGRPNAALIQNTHATEGFKVRFDGTDPTATVGFILEPGDTIFLKGITALRRFRAIRDSGDTEFFVQLFR
jgi:hypothetical protein